MIAFISSGYGADEAMRDVYTISSSSTEPAFYIIDEYDEFINSVEELEWEPMDLAFPLWPDLYEDAPHRVPNHYPPAPRKMLPKRISGRYYNPLKLKQPVARSGFKRGQRR